MDFANGGDLGKCLTKQKETGTYLKEEQVLDWFTQIILAIKHIHSNNILHRDLKTQNIFLTSKGQVKVGDFGISRILKSTEDLAVTAIGTPYYLSPEICEKKPYSYKSDVWSLGCLLYEMLSFKRPFQSSSIVTLVIAILSGKYKPLPVHWSKEIKELVDKMLSVNPDDRPSIDEILNLPFVKKRLPAILKRYAQRDILSREGSFEEDGVNKARRLISSQERRTTSRLVKHKSILASKSKVELKNYSTRIEPRRVTFIKNSSNDSKESTSAFSSDCDYASLMKSLTNCIKTSQTYQKGDNISQDFIL